MYRMLINIMVLLGGLDIVSSGDSEKLLGLLIVAGAACLAILFAAISCVLYILGKKAALYIRKRILLRRIIRGKISGLDKPGDML